MADHRHHLVGEEPLVAVGLGGGHAGIAADRDERLGAGHLLDAGDLVDALRGCAVHLQFGEEVEMAGRAVLLDRPCDAGVVLVALRRSQVAGGELVVTEHGLVVALQVLTAEVASAVLVLVDEGPAGDDRGRGFDAVHLEEELPVAVELLDHRLPGLLRHDHDADAELRHDRPALR